MAKTLIIRFFLFFSVSAAKLLFIHALTPLHPGAGRFGATEVVDLPVQRDEFGFPTIWSSSLKGVLRSSFELRARSQTDEAKQVADETFVRAVFGPEPASLEVSEYSSAISVLDARLLMIPARSLKGVWCYLTSPHLLNYYRVYLEIASNYVSQLENVLKELNKLIESSGAAFKSKKADADRVVLVSDEQCVIKSDQRSVVVLNEEEFTAEEKSELAGIWKLLPAGTEQRSIAVVTDNAAETLLRKSLVVQPRVRLDYERKTVSRGGLWDEEYLPQRTLMVSLIVARQPRQSLSKIAERIAKNLRESENEAKELVDKALKSSSDLDATAILSKLSELKSAMLGGKETVGKGVAKLLWYP
jgi:CRISPR-associated protein Cmr4